MLEKNSVDIYFGYICSIFPGLSDNNRQSSNLATLILAAFDFFSIITYEKEKYLTICSDNIHQVEKMAN